MQWPVYIALNRLKLNLGQKRLSDLWINFLSFKTGYYSFVFFLIQIASFDRCPTQFGDFLFTFCFCMWKFLTIVIERIGMRFERIGRRWKLLTLRVRIDLALKKVIKGKWKIPLGNMHYWCTILGKFFTYVTKTRANLSTYSRKLGNYNGTIIFEIDIIRNSSPLNLKFTFFATVKTKITLPFCLTHSTLSSPSE